MSAARIFATGSIVLALVISAPVHAQDKGKGKATEKAVVTKVLLENDKVRVTESTFEPGAVSRAERKARTNYIVTDGTLERVTKDGKKSRYTRKAGTALYLPADNDVVTNVGKTTYVVIGITHK
jgi:quercetin dioxygenase-like cupin family protein